MQFLQPRRPKGTAHLSDALSWGAMLSDDVVITKQCEFLSVLRFIPRDAASSSPEQLVAARAALNIAVRRLGGGWAAWFECQRNETIEYDTAEWPDPVSRMLDDERRKRFTTPGRQFSSQYFVTLLYAPAGDAVGRLAAHFDDANGAVRDDEKRFRDEAGRHKRGVDAFLHDLNSFMPMAKKVSGDELVTYLHSTISTRRFQVKMPDLPLFVSEYLTDDTFVGGLTPMLGEHHLRTIRIKAQPAETWPGIFDELNNLEFPYRWVSRWLPFSPADAQSELEARKKAWADRRKSLMQKILGRFGMDDGSRDNLDAFRRMEEADAALLALGSGDFSFGMWSQTVTLTHPDVDVLEDRVRTVQRIINSRGFLASIAVDDAMSAWIGSLPGHPLGDLGRFLTSSQTFSEVLPATAVWAGPARDHHLDGPPLLRCMSEGGTPFRFSLHQEGSDVGHMLVIGQTGGGKSVLLSTMIAAHRKYAGSRVIVIDRGASAKCMTLALGGSFHSLAVEADAVSLQPLSAIDNPIERAWSFEWVLGCLEQEGLRATATQKHEITLALETLATRPVRQRTLTTLRALIQDEDVKVTLGTFCLGGACGDLLDNDEHRFGDNSDVVCFETASLLDRPTAVGPVLAVVFHLIERQFDGRPTLLVIDEAWAALDRPLLSAKLREWLKTARKANVSVVLATQSLADIATSNIREVLSESCPTRIFLANDRAEEKASAATLSGFGLTPKQISIIASLKPKSEYVFTAPGAWRKFSLELSPVELAFAGRNRPQDRAKMDLISALCPKEEFARQWLKHCGFPQQQIIELLGEPVRFLNAAE